MVSTSAHPDDHGAEDRLRDGAVLADRYEITGLLGAGGFALVYRARQLNINRPVALKILNAPNNPQARIAYQERFLREAQTAALIRHPNVVTIHDFGIIEDPGDRRPYIVMELLEGHDLKHELQHVGPMHPRRLLPLFIECLEALAEGHGKGIVHKDLKPSNLFITHPGERREALKVLDFGIARLSAPGQDRLTGTGQLMGTPKYYAPEYARHQIVSPALDVYQMGLILVEALSGRPAVPLDDAYACLLRHCNNELEVPEELLTGPLGPALRGALALDHRERFADAGRFVDALERVDPASLAPIAAEGPVRFLNDATGSKQLFVMPGAPDARSDLQPSTLGGPRAAPLAHPNAVVIHLDGRIERSNVADDTGPLPSVDAFGPPPGLRGPLDEGRLAPDDDDEEMAWRPTVTVPSLSDELGDDPPAASILAPSILAPPILAPQAASRAAVAPPRPAPRARVALIAAVASSALAVLILGGALLGLLIMNSAPSQPASDEPAAERGAPSAEDSADGVGVPTEEAALPDPDPEAPRPTALEVRSTPSGAEIWRGGVSTGLSTPASLPVGEGDPDEVVVELRMEGYAPVAVALSRDQRTPALVALTPDLEPSPPARTAPVERAGQGLKAADARSAEPTGAEVHQKAPEAPQVVEEKPAVKMKMLPPTLQKLPGG